MTVTSISTHVLDAALGRPAVGVEVVLTLPDGSEHRDRTDEDGRARMDALPDDPVTGSAAGRYVLTFATGPWFAAQQRDSFHPEVLSLIHI